MRKNIDITSAPLSFKSFCMYLYDSIPFAFSTMVTFYPCVLDAQGWEKESDLYKIYLRTFNGEKEK